MNRAPALFGWAALLTAWAVDLLFWQKTPGISFPLWVTLALLVGLLLARRQKVKISRFSLILMIAVLVFAFFTCLRRDTFTILISVVLCLAFLALLSATLLTGNWPFYRIGDYTKALLKLGVAVLVRPVELFTHKAIPQAEYDLKAGSPGSRAASDSQAADAPPAETDVSSWQQAGKTALPILRRLLLALPVVLVLGALLASADPVFDSWFRDLLKIFDLAKLPEYIFRLIYILVLTYGLAGVFLHAVLPAVAEPRPNPLQRWTPSLLGWIEAVVILGAVNLLFIVFVGIQSWYLFGGQANISTTGFTYAEYARRGFNELVFVAVLSLLLYLGLAAITRQEGAVQPKVFSGLTILLMVQVLVILASSFSRLLMYENAYGFTELRTYTHIFILWLALLLAAAIALEVIRRRGHFGLSALIVLTGFGLTIGILNVDGFIAAQNIQRAQADGKLDGQYLASLSEDAVPTLLAAFQAGNQPEGVRDMLGAELACRTALIEQDPPPTSWLSYNFSQATAASLLRNHSALWQNYTVKKDARGALTVQIPGGIHACRTSRFVD